MEEVAKAHIILTLPQSSSFKSTQFSLYLNCGREKKKMDSECLR